MLAGEQKFDKSFDIMSLKKPQNGKSPTALFISKFQLLSKNRNQEVFRIIPYSFNINVNNKEEEQEDNNVVDLTKVSTPLPVETNKIVDKVEKLSVNNIDQFL
mgnify:CR=1 FL=1